MSRPRRATALRYDRGSDGAPKVVASGRDLIADQIVERAQAAGVPVREDPALVEALERLELGQEIPTELFTAVAEALVWAYKLDRRQR
jgi:flagellar biosynthesis protein